MPQQESEIRMDQMPVREVVIEIEHSVNTTQEVEVENPDLLDAKVGMITSSEVCNTAVSSDGVVKIENGASLIYNAKNTSNGSPVLEKNARKEKRKSHNAKKPPKPPRPTSGFSIDAADQKLIKEIAELAMIKRARIERMKALKKMKAAKASSVSSSSGNLIALLFTVVFCIVIIFQGMSPGNSSSVGFHGSPETNAGPESGFMVVQNQQNIVTSSIASRSPNVVERAPGSGVKIKPIKRSSEVE